jgi:hypothetical protein
MPAKAKGPGSMVVMAKTRLMGLGDFTLFVSLTGGVVPNRSPDLAGESSGSGSGSGI